MVANKCRQMLNHPQTRRIAQLYLWHLGLVRAAIQFRHCHTIAQVLLANRIKRLQILLLNGSICPRAWCSMNRQDVVKPT